MRRDDWEERIPPYVFRRNPTKGTIINRPNGDDVYHGVPHDYTRLVEDECHRLKLDHEVDCFSRK